MKNALHTPVAALPDSLPNPSEHQTYSLFEAAQVMGVPLAEFREMLEKHELHPEHGRRGERVSRREVFAYVSRHPTRVAKTGRSISA